MASHVQRYCPTCERMVLALKDRTNHILHLLMSVVTVGLWLPVWLIAGIRSDHRKPLCSVCGGKTRLRA